jgi:hypothetical protein
MPPALPETERNSPREPFSVSVPRVTTPESLENSGPSLGRNAQGREALAEGSLGALISARQTVVVAEKEKMPPNYAAPDDPPPPR